MIHSMHLVREKPDQARRGAVGPIAYTADYVGLVFWAVMDTDRIDETKAAVREVASRFPDRLLVVVQPPLPGDVEAWLVPRNRKVAERLRCKGKQPPGFEVLGSNDDFVMYVISP
jgi:hypothetical protein